MALSQTQNSPHPGSRIVQRQPLTRIRGVALRERLICRHGQGAREGLRVGGHGGGRQYNEIRCEHFVWCYPRNYRDELELA